MRNSIESITEKTPTPSTLPDGFYVGTWGGYVITVQYKEKTYELKTKEGVRGVNIRVVIEVKDGIATFEEVNS